MSEWISVNDRLPATRGYYLVVGHGRYIFISLYADDRWLRQSASKRLNGITHWMPLPETPKEAE